jgi:hypothetical protein
MRPLEQLDHDDSVNSGPITYGEFLKQDRQEEKASKRESEEMRFRKLWCRESGNFAP